MPRSPAKQAKPPRRSSAKQEQGAADRPLQPTQRERLLTAMARVVEREGYTGASIANVTAQAGVGRVTFYNEFADKQTCFIASYDNLALRLSAQLSDVMRVRERDSALRSALSGLLQTLEAEPQAGWGMLFEPIGGGPELRRHSRRKLIQAAAALERFLASAPPEEPRPGIPALALIGGIRHVVARRLRRLEYDILPALTDDLFRWVKAYALPSGAVRGPGFLSESSLVSGGLLRPSRGRRPHKNTASAHDGASGAAATQRLPRGRRMQHDSVVKRQLRERILGATTQMAMLKGYHEMTVADIVACAGIGRGVFYAQFRDKQEAFLAAQQHNFEDHMSTCATAFFTASAWPERIWNGLRTATKIIEEDPALAHLWLVESFAAGSAAIHNAEELRTICTLYLHEAYSLSDEAGALPQLCSEAILGAIYELLYQMIDDGHGARVSEALPELAYIAIAPFTGVRQAAELIEGYMRASA